MNELAVIKHLKNNEYFIEVEEYIKTDHNYWLVATFCNGGPLSDLITHFPGTLNAGILRKIMRKLTAAQDWLTKAKLFHSDLTPSNIMLHVPSETHNLNRLDFYNNKLKEAEVKIIDFANIAQLRKKPDG